jgi:ABC-type phosphate transport system permease subunit
MFDFLTEFISSITLRSALIGLAIFVVTFLVSLTLVSIILVKLPADHFKKDQETKFWSGPRPALGAAGIIGKNILGILLVVVGIVLSIPGVPGQGLLTILLGIMLVDFPGKRRLEQKLLAREEVRKTINRLRARFDKPPLELDS